MDSIFGLVGNGYVLLAADAAAARSILVFKHDEDKIRQLDDKKLMATSGVAADNLNFGEYISKNMKLYELNNDVKMSPTATANYIRGEVGSYTMFRTLSFLPRPNLSVLVYSVGHSAAKRPISNEHSFGRSR
jgi:20S proteasome alpha/beta subunit